MLPPPSSSFDHLVCLPTYLCHLSLQWLQTFGEATAAPHNSRYGHMCAMLEVTASSACGWAVMKFTM